MNNFISNKIEKIKERFSFLFSRYGYVSFSQEGEDMLLRNYLHSVKNGFYVDVGAYHPKRFSNTYYFYNRGWKGINIDPMPGSMKLFNKSRPRDINLEIAISNKQTETIFYEFDNPPLNSLDGNLSELRDKEGSFKIVKKHKIKPVKLEKVLDKYKPNNTEIDLLTIDVEGHELSVIKSNNWKKYRPKIILIEELMDEKSSETDSFLRRHGYTKFSKLYRTAFYIRNNFKIDI